VTAREAHLDQARANLAHAEYLLSSRRSDPTAVQWAMSAVFYCAVHCVEAHLATFNVHCKTHGERRRALVDPQYQIPLPVQLGYIHLQDWSEQARYEVVHFDPELVERAGLGQFLRREIGGRRPCYSSW
jgi:hypothetical protein